MRTQQIRWTRDGGWVPSDPASQAVRATLIMVFGSRRKLADDPWRAPLARDHPGAHIVGCSTAGEILGDEVTDDSLVATCIEFERTRCEVRSIQVRDPQESEAAGSALVRSLPTGHLAHVLVLSDGQRVNGSALVRGMVAALPVDVAVTGGLAGDGSSFEKTLVSADGEPREGMVAVVGLYGDSVRVGYGSLGGWDPFGPEREVTAAAGSVLIELDGQPALWLYKRYLGEHAAGLPATGLLFPLAVRTKDGRTFVRTILGIDEAQQSLRFAGDIPVGSYARLMKANFDRLVDGAHGAAATSREGIGSESPDLAILISCVGRKLVLQQRTDEEVEAVRDVLGPRSAIVGFYSYGEICPAAPSANCELHNQTMTITTISER